MFDELLAGPYLSTALIVTGSAVTYMENKEVGARGKSDAMLSDKNKQAQKNAATVYFVFLSSRHTTLASCSTLETLELTQTASYAVRSCIASLFSVVARPV